ncbi:hypothetical protein PSEG_05417 [Pseudomonas sp. Nvir]|jgi:hypothetical protein|nr:hypothetical protein FPB55_25275 [Pseudomonas sp. BJP69]RRV61612.1 hypothetical protein EGJ15_19175 [Pseudomonas sp. p99-361]CAH0646535.1 hypothetical protein PSNVIR_00794 [Pseudomonas sp. Nvir]SUD80936.1 Uncharacterised protein [Pseudomonas putida]
MFCHLSALLGPLIWRPITKIFCGPVRGHARSHRDRGAFTGSAVPVGAGVPSNGAAKQPQLLQMVSVQS